MNPGQRVAVMSDVHGEYRGLRAVLDRCRAERVDSVVLLGDLFDRVDQADACARILSDWAVSGVIGNHEREALESTLQSNRCLDARTRALLASLGEHLMIEDAAFVHDAVAWRPDHHRSAGSVASRWITFAGHTHFRSARDENGPIDLALGRIRTSRERRYLINPGAVVEGQFAIWDRRTAQILFERV